MSPRFSLFSRKTSVLDPHTEACLAVLACSKRTTNDHCRLGDQLAYICGEHLPLAPLLGEVEA